MLTEDQIKFYKENGYLLIENAIPPKLLKGLQDITDEFVESSRSVTENDETYDLSDDHSRENPRLRRLKQPHLLHKTYEDITIDDCILEPVSQLLGNNLRRDHTKLNFKLPGGGEAIEWHQDWAFYPHTNDDIVEVSIFLDDCEEANGPLLVVPGSHLGPLDDHHHNGYFIGAVDPVKSHYDVSTASKFIAKAGAISFHHVRALHGSTKNNSDKSRRMFFVGYTAADSWPLKGILDLGLSPTSGEGDFVKNIFEVYNSNIVKGQPCLEARVESNPIKMPYPPPPSVGSIYENQREVLGRSFGE
jgi:ectoine hydroxylase-related dioxygenase (phytanoyl-CoA dioxygenase family)